MPIIQLSAADPFRERRLELTTPEKVVPEQG